MEYADGGDLDEYANKKVGLGEVEAKKLFKQILGAVRHCHQSGVCHNDLKPNNILLTKEGVVKLADFGFAAGNKKRM